MKKGKVLWTCATLGFTLSAVSVILMMLPIQSVITGVIFWLGVLTGIILYIITACVMSGETKKDISKVPGILRFFSNIPAIITDILMIVSLILTIYFAMDYRSNQTAAAIILFVFILSFYMHFMLNGKVFKCIYNARKEGRARKKEEKADEGIKELFLE